jgi:hypothetical protein
MKRILAGFTANELLESFNKGRFASGRVAMLARSR